MARTNIRLVEAHNKLLTICNKMEVGASLPPENALANKLSVSRTVIRGALERMNERGIIILDGRQKTILRPSTHDDLMEGPPILLGIEDLEKRFFDWVLRMDVPPHTVLNVAQVAKEFQVATHTLQEFLSSLSRYGIVARRPRGGWQLEGFTETFALELSDFRAILELNAVRQLVTLPSDHAVWEKLDELEALHLALLERIDENYHDFSRLDEKFHQTINSVVENRFIKDSQKIISLIFHYHFQWNKSDERTRNECAIHEHLAIIATLRSRDPIKAEAAAREHLATSSQTLVNSLRAHDHAL